MRRRRGINGGRGEREGRKSEGEEGNLKRKKEGGDWGWEEKN